MYQVRKSISAFCPAVTGWWAAAVCALPLCGHASFERLTVPLDFQVSNDGYVYFSLSETTRTEPFAKEPPASGDWRRGTLKIMESEALPIAFLWDRTGALRLDLNRNGDLTDDPVSKPSHRYAGGSYVNCTFTNMQWMLGTNAGQKPIIADLTFSERSGRWLNVHGRLKSYRAGKLEIEGNAWEIGLGGFNNKTRHGELGETLIVRPWAEKAMSFSANTGDPAAFSRTEKIFVSGKSFRLSVARDVNGDPAALNLDEETAETGDLNVSGEHIAGLLLKGANCAAVFSNPGKTVKLPVGEYTSYYVQLGRGNDRALRARDRQDHPVRVRASTPAVLKAGGPLLNSVGVSQSGTMIRMNFRLQGADGATYEFPVKTGPAAPQFTIYNGDRKVASGKFEYG